MSDFSTLGGLLAAQSERKLDKLRRGILDEIERLGFELKIVDEALARKRKQKLAASARRQTAEPDMIAETDDGLVAVEVKSSNGSSRTQFKGLSRDDLLTYVQELGGGPVSAPQMRDFLRDRGIVKSTEAVRVGLTRLYKGGKLDRVDGMFSLPSNRDADVGSEDAAASGDALFGHSTEPDRSGAATPDG